MGKGDWVFAVHSWETADGRHHNVTVSVGGKEKTRRFLLWRKAEAYANSQAKKLGLKKYQVDTPKRPHVMVKVR